MEISQTNSRKENLGQMVSAMSVEQKITGKPHLNVQNANQIVMVAIQQKYLFDRLKSLEKQEVGKVLDKRYFTILNPEAAGHFVTIGGHNQVPIKGRGSIHSHA